MRPVLAILAILVAITFAVLAFDRPLPRAELNLINGTEFITLDPQRTTYAHDIRLNYAIYETLTRWNTYSDFEIIPGLAQHWSVSDDGLEYTFHLDPNGRWSNGSPVLAEHFVYSWRRALYPDTAADYSNLFFVIEGAEDFFHWRARQLDEYTALTDEQKIARFPDIARQPGLNNSERLARAAQALRQESIDHFNNTVGIRAIDDYTLHIRLERPTAYFLDLCAFAPFAPCYPPLVERFATLETSTGRIQQAYDWTKPPLLITNGPYVPTDWQFKRGMFLERNPHFRIPNFAKSATVRIIPINDPNTAVLAFQTGLADFHTDVRVDYIADMLAQKEQGLNDYAQPISTFGTYYWNFNCREFLSDGRRNPFHDPRVRRAFAMTVDKHAIMMVATRAGEKSASVFIPPGSIPGFNSPQGLPYDIPRARREFNEAGWFIGDDGLARNAQGDLFPTVRMLYSTGSYNGAVALALGQMWRQHLGVRAEFDAKETKAYRADLQRQNFMLARGGWFGDYGDPTTFLALHRTGDGNNNSAHSDPYFDDLLNQADNERDPEKRMRILEEAERYTMEETLPILPIFHYNWYFLYKSPEDAQGRPNPGGLRGMSSHPRNVQYLWLLEVVRQEELDAYLAAEAAR